LPKQRRREFPTLPMVGAGALVQKRGKVLLVRRRFPPNKGRWALTGGLVELGETVEEATKREVKEEVGIDVLLTGLLDVANDIHLDRKGRVKYHYVLVDFLAAPIGGDIRLNNESSEFRWFDPKEVQYLNASKNTKAVVKKFLNQKRRG
jgi:8-oxo-dGTP diphosphatase